MIAKERQELISLLNDMYYSQGKAFKEQYEQNYFTLLSFLVETAEEEKPLVDVGYRYTITEDMDEFCKGDYFRGEANNTLRHIKTGTDLVVGEQGMKNFVKLSLYKPEMGMNMHFSNAVPETNLY